MKLRKDDKVIVLLGKDKGKTGTVLAVIPTENKVVVEGVNIVKRATKPSQKQPRGGILEITKAINASKLMVLDPASGKPARVGFQIKADGTKERIFKVSANHSRRAEKTKSDKVTTKESPKVASSETKAGKK